MRRIGLIGLILTLAMAAHSAPPIEMSVTTNPVMVLPPRSMGRSEGSLWLATNAVSQGAILRWGGNHYMVQSAGITGTNAPVFVSGIETNGSAVLRYAEKGPRLGFVLMLNSEGSVRVNLNSPAIPGSGIQLEGKNSLWQESYYGAPQVAIWVVSDVGTNRVAVLEW